MLIILRAGAISPVALPSTVRGGTETTIREEPGFVLRESTDWADHAGDEQLRLASNPGFVREIEAYQNQIDRMLARTP